MTKIKYVRWLPNNFAGMTPFPCRIYIRKKMLDRPFTDRARLINHERVHIKQMLRDGYWHWLWRYAFSGRWRAVYELEAYTSNILDIVGSGIVSSALAAYYIDKVLNRYYPRWWPFNKGKPTFEQAQAILKSFVDGYYV